MEYTIYDIWVCILIIIGLGLILSYMTDVNADRRGRYAFVRWLFKDIIKFIVDTVTGGEGFKKKKEPEPEQTKEEETK